MQLHKPLSQGEAAAGARIWVVRGGVRDLIALVSDYLEQLRTDLEYLMKAPTDGKLGREQLQAIEGALPELQRRFNRRSLPDKFSALEGCGLAFHPDLTELRERVLSINAARNCLEHRMGRVSEKDVDANDGNVLRVRWVAQEFMAELEDGTVVPAKAGMFMENLIVRRRAPREREYALGGQVFFSAQDMVELAWTMAALADEMLVAINAEISRRAGAAVGAAGESTVQS